MKTEKEKMLAGELYFSADADLTADRERCKDLCHEYNVLRPSNTARQQEIIKKLFGKVGENCFLTAPFWCDYGYNMEVGENFYSNHNCVFLDCAKITFGNNVFVAPNCCFSTATHPIDAATRNQYLEYAHPITVGSDVWFGAGVTVLPGVTIGSNVVIGAGSVVTKSLPDNVLAFGNPCRVVRELEIKNIP